MADGSGNGEDVVRRLWEGLQLEDEWTVRTELSTTWWGGALAQQIRVEPGAAGTRVEVATDLLTGVTDGAAVTELLSALNRFAILSALAWEPHTGEIVLRASAFWTRANAGWVEPLLLAAVTLQAAQAH